MARACASALALGLTGPALAGQEAPTPAAVRAHAAERGAAMTLIRTWAGDFDRDGDDDVVSMIFYGSLGLAPNEVEISFFRNVNGRFVHLQRVDPIPPGRLHDITIRTGRVSLLMSVPSFGGECCHRRIRGHRIDILEDSPS